MSTVVEKRKTKRPAKPAAGSQPSAEGTPVNLSGELIAVALTDCHRHRDNRRPSAAEVTNMADSLERDKQLEPILIRRHTDPDFVSPFQIVSGETRWLAARQLGWKCLDARVVDCDDGRALELLAVANAARTDLNPIQKAQLIERLCQTRDSGGAGLTREQAGRIYGLESGSAASNLVRLLKLPKEWQNRVAAGELPGSFARVLVGVAHVKSVMVALDDDWRQSRDDIDGSDWANRHDVERLVHMTLNQVTRPIDKKTTVSLTVGGKYRGWSPMAFKLTDELRVQLCIAKVSVGDGEREVATNVDLWDELQVQALDAKAAKSQAGVSDKADKQRKATVDPKERAKELAEQLRKRLDRWKHRVLRVRIGDVIANRNAPAWVSQKLVLWLFAHRGSCSDEMRLDRDELIVLSSGKKTNGRITGGDSWGNIHQVTFESPLQNVPAKMDSLYAAVAAGVLNFESKNPDWPLVPTHVLEDLAEDLGLTWRIVWSDLQDQQSERDQELFAACFACFVGQQLDALGKELGVHVAEAATNKAKIRLLTAQRGRTLPLPKCLEAQT